jgi:hypothetical protein
VRPTDENQHGSTRPNLMSPSRPGGGEDNILAMLERDAGRGRGKQFSSHPRMAWYAGAGALVVAMVGALGWLAWENATKTRELPLETTQAQPAGDTRIAAAQAVPAAPAAAAVKPAVAMVQTEGAAIIDSPAAPAEAPVLLAQAAPNAASTPQVPAQVAAPSKLPPLVLLSPEEARPKRAPAAPAAAAAQPTAAASAPPKADAAHASRHAAKADAAPASRPAAKVPPHRPARPLVARAKKAPGHAAPGAPANPGDAAPDSDVALISAIIMHSSKHAAERAKAEAAKSCDGRKCPAKPAAKQRRRQKTTDAPPGT